MHTAANQALERTRDSARYDELVGHELLNLIVRTSGEQDGTGNTEGH